MGKYYAHSLAGRPKEEWQELASHLKETAELAKVFADEFSNGDWAYLTGLWHDLGKYLPDWQNYLLRERGYPIEHASNGKRPNHSTAGAIFAFEKFKDKPLARLFASIIAGHHAGLPDWYPDEAGGDLQNRIFNSEGNLRVGEIEDIRNNPLTKPILETKLPRSNPLNISSKEEGGSASEHLHLWVRMLFSCLVDADFLNTEQACNPESSKFRGTYSSLETLYENFRGYMSEKCGAAEKTPINKYRRKVLEDCMAKATAPSGFFSLTVPTGGGKTLSAMAFALKHAMEHKKKRVIMAIPYTSIIEQTAEVYRHAFGDGAVLEHHSNIDIDEEDKKGRLASENWDAPIIVTTNVQLFESLLASRPSSCRKLHNLANSVIILDEAQMLPPEYLKPILSVLRGLVAHFGVTVVFCTATQPVLCGKIGSEQAEFAGISSATAIVPPDAADLKDFKRVDIDLPISDERTTWENVSEELQKYEQVLCIVNTRQDCRDLHGIMPKGTVHLSANMCGEERSEAIADIKKRLANKMPIRVVGTQLVEAGVDIDFPVVFRALAGIDSISQAAGRCNREGKLNAEGMLGKLFVFHPPKSSPVGMLRKGEYAARTILRKYKAFDLSPELYRDYFSEFYRALNDFDRPKFQERMQKEAGDFIFQFRTFAGNVRLIDDTVQKGIIVRYKGKNKSSFELIELLKRKGPDRWIMRKLQRFIVNVPLNLFYKLQNEGHIEDVFGCWVQSSTGLYKPGYGLLADVKDWDKELFIV